MLAIAAAVVAVVQLRKRAPPEAVRLLPGADGFFYINLKWIRTFNATNRTSGAAVWGLSGSTSGPVLALALSADGGHLLAGGDFSVLGGAFRNRLAAVNPLTGALDTSIAIRTAVVRDGRVYFSAGGGIVADSVPDEEYRETLDKARATIDVLAAR